MLLYNVTSIVEDTAAERWLQWMQETHIPNVMKTELFVSYRMLKVLDSPNEGITFCTQYIIENMTSYLEYQEKFAPQLQAEVNQLFANQFVSFRTLMEYIA